MCPIIANIFLKSSHDLSNLNISDLSRSHQVFRKSFQCPRCPEQNERCKISDTSKEAIVALTGRTPGDKDIVCTRCRQVCYIYRAKPVQKRRPQGKPSSSSSQGKPSSSSSQGKPSSSSSQTRTAPP